MPEVSRFYGIVVRIFYDDHNPPHLHAEYGEHEVLVNINTLAILSGNLPARARPNGPYCISKNCGQPGREQDGFSRPARLSLCRESSRWSHNNRLERAGYAGRSA